MTPQRHQSGTGATPSDRRQTPGLKLSQQRPVDPDVAVELGDQPPSEFWETLVGDGFMDALYRAVESAVGAAHHGQRASILEELSVTAMEGVYATVIANLLRSEERGADRPEAPYARAQAQVDFEADALSITRAFARGEDTIFSVRAPFDELNHGPLAVFRAGDAVPVIAVSLTDAFRDRRSDQRERICAMLAKLATAADVRVVGTGRLHRWLADTHRADLPGGVRDQCRPTHSARPTGDTDELAAARDALGFAGPEMWALRQLADEDSETLSYDALSSASWAARETVRGHINTLADLDLVARFGPHQHRKVELLPLGRDLVRAADEAVGRQATLSSGVFETVNPQIDSRVSTPSDGEGEEAPSDQGRPVDAPGHRVEYPVGVAYMPQWRHNAAVAAADGGITVADAPQPAKANRHEPEWSYDSAAARLVVGAEYDNPLAYMVRLALALADGKTFQQVLTDGVLDEIVAEDLTDGPGAIPGAAASRSILRDGTCVGWLPDEVEDGADFREELESGRETLLDLTSSLGSLRDEWGFESDSDDERVELRKATIRHAHGLAGVMAHLLHLADIEVTRECRFPGRVSQYTDERDRRDLAKNLQHMAAIQSTHGYYAAYRQLFESDDDKREAAMEPEVDAAAPWGELIGDVVVVGHGASILTEHLRDRFDETQSHEEAPEFGVPIRIRDAYDRRQAAQATRAMCAAKNLEATREAVSVLHGFTGSPYGVCRALHALSPEHGRRIRLDEVRFALATLETTDEGASDLLPAVNPTERDAVRALLRAEAPLSQATLAERAGRTRQSIRNNEAHLAALDLVRRTDAGYRIVLPIPDVDGRGNDPRPWYLVPDRDRDDFRSTTTAGVVWEAATAVEPGAMADPHTGPGAAWFDAPDPPAALAREWRWVNRWLPTIRRLTDGVSGDPAPVILGDEPEQAPLPRERGTEAPSGGVPAGEAH